METSNQHILVVGSSSPLLEGVADLLQVAGYRVATSSSWAETLYVLHITPPSLLVVDLSSGAPEAYRLTEKIRRVPRWANVPILFVSFSGDDTIRYLQRRSLRRPGGPIHFYAHTVLSIEGLLDKVKACLLA